MKLENELKRDMVEESIKKGEPSATIYILKQMGFRANETPAGSPVVIPTTEERYISERSTMEPQGYQLYSKPTGYYWILKEDMTNGER